MPDNDKIVQNENQLVVEKSELENIKGIKDDVFATSLEDIPSRVVYHIKRLGTSYNEFSDEPICVFLKSLWNYFEAVKILREEANFVNASSVFKEAADGFDRIGDTELRDMSLGLYVYAEALKEIQNLNIKKGLELVESIKTYLKKAGGFGGLFEPMIDHMQPDALFLAATNALMTLDHQSARPLIEKASEAAMKVANKYYEKETLEYNVFIGLSHFYKAFYTFNRASSNLFKFDFNDSSTIDILLKDATTALRFFSMSDHSIAMVKGLHHFAKVVIGLLEVTNELQTIFKEVFSQSSRLDLEILLMLKKKINQAENDAALSGQNSAIMLRYCNGYEALLNNLSPFARKLEDSGSQNLKPIVFIASSSEGKEVAQIIQKDLKDLYNVEIWYQDTVFGLGNSYIEALEKAVSTYDYGIFIFTPDDELHTRGMTKTVARDNVIFELGLFIGKLSRFRAFVVHPAGDIISLPSDLNGMSTATYDHSQHNLRAALGPACDDIRRAIDKTVKTK